MPAGLAAAVPDGLAMGDAVALTVQGLTAHYLTRSTVKLTPDHDIVVTAAAGGTADLLSCYHLLHHLQSTMKRYT